MNGLYLITTNDWFYAPDGRQYRGVWGNVTILQDTFLGVKTNARSANWFAKVGSDEDHVIVAGCQIHYATFCPNRPDPEQLVDNFDITNGVVTEYQHKTLVYITK